MSQLIYSFDFVLLIKPQALLDTLKYFIDGKRVQVVAQYASLMDSGQV